MVVSLNGTNIIKPTDIQTLPTLSKDNKEQPVWCYSTKTRCYLWGNKAAWLLWDCQTQADFCQLTPPIEWHLIPLVDTAAINLTLPQKNKNLYEVSVLKIEQHNYLFQASPLQERDRSGEKFAKVVKASQRVSSLYNDQAELIERSNTANELFLTSEKKFSDHFASLNEAQQIWDKLKVTKSFSGDMEVHTCNGKRWHHISIEKIIWNDGSINFHVFEHDVHNYLENEQQLLTSLKEQNAVLDNASIGIGFIRDRRILRCNKRFEEIFDYSHEELVGENSLMLYPNKEVYKKLGDEGYPVLNKGQCYRTEMQMKRRSDELFWASITLNLIDSENPDEGAIWIVEDIQEYKLAQDSLHNILAQQQLILDHAMVGIMFLKDRKVSQCNNRFEEMFGYTLGELKGGSSRNWYLSDEDWRNAGRLCYEPLKSGRTFSAQMLLGKKDGTPVWCEVQSRAIDSSDLSKGSIWITKDIHEERLAQEALNKLLDEQRVILDHAMVGIISTIDNKLTRCNRRFEEIFGYQCGEVDGASSRLWYTNDADWKSAGERCYGPLNRGESYSEEMYLRRKDGSQIWCDVRGSACDPNDITKGIIWIFMDITERKQAELSLKQIHQELELRVKQRTQELNSTIKLLHDEVEERKLAEEKVKHLALHDPLTSLPNRNLLEDRLNEALHHADRTKEQVVLLFIDLDRFKNINDSLGHQHGDSLLKEVAKRLTDTVRETDTVARFGGDEFIIVLTHITSDYDIENILNNLQTAFEKVISVGTNEVFLTLSTGISVYPQDGKDIASLMKSADAAMYHSKSHGRNRYQFFNRGIEQHINQRIELESELYQAIERNQLHIYYQPKVCINKSEIRGVEALLRWIHPEKGFISPAEFIPVAEETGYINKLGHWVLKEAVAQAEQWRLNGIKNLVVSVNLSAVQLSQSDIVAQIAQVIEEAKLPAELLELELTESAVMNNVEKTIDTLNRIHELGVQLSIDDFGTGYSSLSYLKRFPLDTLKIDQSFVRDITTDADDATICKTIVAMAHSLNLKVIAEGVETDQQLAELKSYGCGQYQGFLFAKPLPVKEISSLLLATIKTN